MKAFKNSGLVFVVVALTSTVAWAQKANDTIVGIGLAVISPAASLGGLNSTGPAAIPFNAATAGATASIDRVTTLTLSVLHMFSDNIGAELSLGIPPKFTVDVRLASGAHPSAATAKELTPALVGKYFFRTSADTVRPYLGLGVAHASFSGVSANIADPVIARLAGTSASLSSSWAPVYNAGLVYNINERYSINASLSYIPLKTTATFVGSGTTTSGQLKINPTDLVIRLGYKF